VLQRVIGLEAEILLAQRLSHSTIKHRACPPKLGTPVLPAEHARERRRVHT
jgi:hypothetical protein